MLYESASRASAVLALNIEDLDLPNKKARVTVKGGDTMWITWGTDTAHLLPRLIAGRDRGPLFLSTHRPGPHRRATTDPRDLCPDTGRARLGYDRARILLGQYGDGLRLQQLRHSSATHLGDPNTSANVIMAKTGHQSLRSVQRYVRPGLAAVHQATETLSSPRRRGSSGSPQVSHIRPIFLGCYGDPWKRVRTTGRPDRTCSAASGASPRGRASLLAGVRVGGALRPAQVRQDGGGGLGEVVQLVGAETVDEQFAHVVAVPWGCRVEHLSPVGGEADVDGSALAAVAFDEAAVDHAGELVMEPALLPADHRGEVERAQLAVGGTGEHGEDRVVGGGQPAAGLQLRLDAVAEDFLHLEERLPGV